MSIRSRNTHYYPSEKTGTKPLFQRQKEPKFYILEKNRVTKKKEKRDLPEITMPDLAALYCSSEKF